MTESNRDFYDADLRPYVIRAPDVVGYPQIFQVAGGLPFPSSEQVIRAINAGCAIDIGVAEDSGSTFDLSSIAEAIPVIRELTISAAGTVRGWAELARATALEEFLIMGEEDPPEFVPIGELPVLRNVGVLGENSLAACANPSVQTLALRLPRSRAVPTIESPLTGMSLTSKNSHMILERMARPELLRSLIVFGAKDFDCRVLLRFPELDEVERFGCAGVINAGALVDVPRLRSLEITGCRVIDDPEALKDLKRTLSDAADREHARVQDRRSRPASDHMLSAVIRAFREGDFQAVARERLSLGRISRSNVESLARRLGDGLSGAAWEYWAEAETLGRATRGVAYVLSNAGDDAAALRLFLEAARLGERCDVEIGESYARLERWPEAETYFRRAVNGCGEWWRLAAFRLGAAAFADGRTDDEVVGWLEAAVPEFDEALADLARLHVARGELDLARRVLEKKKCREKHRVETS